MEEIKILSCPLIDDHLSKKDMDVLLALPMGSQVTFTGFGSPIKLSNGASFAQAAYMRAYLSQKNAKAKIVERNLEDMSLTLQLVQR